MALLPIRRTVGGVPARRSEAGQGMSRLDPWNDFDVMDRMFDSFFRAPFSALGRMPAASDANVEIYETPEEVRAYVFAPGIPQDAFDINVTGDTLTIKGERKPLFEAPDGTVSHTPWGGNAASSGTFSASYTLPVEVDANKAQANYRDGVLEVRMPKSEAAKPKQIKLQVQHG